ncbi:MAG: SUMF1/EgtB/PvdO family nonheme iron enzyme [Verrucomicrobia bacterium]|nr:SUMF1/EgtB/PvdO family nonheme iron enzyme [Verrucomicrobiota bacterium]
MKIAILGDIHGNLEALLAVLADAEGEKVDEFLSVGDIVGYGPNPRECIHIIRDQLKCPCVLGNHDHLASADLSTMSSKPSVAEAIGWTREQLDADDRKYLANLPLVLHVHGLTLVHATLDMPQSWGYVFDRLAAASSMSRQTTRVCFFGHTHVPLAFIKEGPVRTEHGWSSMDIKEDCQYFINVGSIGQPRDGNPKTGYVIYDTDAQCVRIKRLTYDIAAVQDKARQAGIFGKHTVRPIAFQGMFKLACSGENMSIDLGGGVMMELVFIRPGLFCMGSDKGRDDEKPAHQVTLTKPFFMNKYAVTQEQWQAVMGTNPSHNKSAKNPVENVSWDNCQRFLSVLNMKLRGLKASLPTEAQWEYACRAGGTDKYCCGDDESGLAEYAWYSANARGSTHAVGLKKPNAWGLYDMNGNVREWVSDWHGPYPNSAQEDPQGPASGTCRVLRGGGFGSDHAQLTTSCRDELAPDFRNDDVGFRLVLMAGGAAP